MLLKLQPRAVVGTPGRSKMVTAVALGEVTVKKRLHPDLDAEAIKAMKQWQFQPGTKEGKAVDVAVEVEMTFNLK